MSDPNGLNWAIQPPGKKPTHNASFGTLKPTPPASGRTSPLPPRSPNPTTKPGSSTNDSFSGLVSFSSTTNNKSLSLQEQQKRLASSRLQPAGSAQTLLGNNDDAVWASLGSGRSTPSVQSSGIPKSEDADDEDDFLAAFNKPQTKPPAARAELNLHQNASSTTHKMNKEEENDDDPFGMAEFQARNNARPIRKADPTFSPDEDDDVLGLLGRPANERLPAKTEPKPFKDLSHGHPQDKAVAELVDMGFPPDKARAALESTASGTDVQGAVGWLLNQAHTESTERSRMRNGGAETMSRLPESRVLANGHSQSRQQSRSATPSNDTAAEFGAAFIKTAGSLWKQGQKRFQQAVQDFNSDSDSSQPKWMRESRQDTRSQEQVTSSATRKFTAERVSPEFTDEAMLLETARPERPQRTSHRETAKVVIDSNVSTFRDQSPATAIKLGLDSANLPKSAPHPPSQMLPSRAALSRKKADEEASQAYVSSARRRRPADVSNPSVASVSLNGDLLGSTSGSTTRKTGTSTAPTVSKPARATSTIVRPSAPKRVLPQISAISLKASHADRETGNEQFKRGDYSSAHISYSKSLLHLPNTHPIRMILLTNRALTSIKTGDPKLAVIDTDAVINLIGPSKGESEFVDLCNGDTPKPMRDYYGKALMRKAEALEHMEKWADAAMTWREAVESGHGGATAVQGRARTEKASNPQPTKPKSAAPTKKPTVRAAVTSRAGVQSEAGAAAVSRLRAQNAAADKADDEKFALADTVDTRLNAWKGGKADNLRALLGSLDLVLWPEAGWKKISMADLVLPNKVKIQYMKGIAKVHPDKIPVDATTEQRMIAGAVFSTLNEAWDVFKAQNNL